MARTPSRPAPGWLVYLLRCGDGSLYTGITNDLDKRLEAHRAGKASRYTRSRLPVTLAYAERQPGRSPALRREAAIKKLGKAAKERLVGLASGTTASRPGRRGPPAAAGRRIVRAAD